MSGAEGVIFVNGASRAISVGTFAFLDFYLKSLAFHYRLRDLTPGGTKNSSEGGPGDAHLFRCFFMVKTLMVGEVDGFELIRREGYFVEFRNRDASRLKIHRIRAAYDTPAFFWPSHTLW